MASGDTLYILTGHCGSPPSTNFATPDIIEGADGDAKENFPVYDFDADADEYMDYHRTMPEHYDGGGITITVIHFCLGDNSNPWKVGIAFRAMKDDADDADTTDHAYDFNTADMNPAGTAGELGYDDVTFTNGADMDSVVAGDAFILRVMRDISEDGMTGDASVYQIHIKET